MAEEKKETGQAAAENAEQKTADPAQSQTKITEKPVEGSDDMINMTLEPNEPMDHNPSLDDLKKQSDFISRMSDKALISEKTGSSVSIRKNGQVNLSSSNYAQYKLNPGGKAIEQSMESITMTNRRRIISDEIVVNDHKLNPRLYEFTDFKEVQLTTNQKALVGNFCVMGTVLVKAWEANLKRYVMIRRPCRMPMFSPLLNLPKVMPDLGITDPLEFEEDILALSDKGYQVNGMIEDAKSLIGKEGVDRPGINRNNKVVITDGGGAPGSSSSSSPAGSTTGGGATQAHGAKFEGDGDLKIVDTNLTFKDMQEQSGVADIVIHHTGDGKDNDESAQTIHGWHLDKGWAGIGYHFVIRKNGTIERGRPEKYVGSHCQGHNTGSIGIHVCGDYEKNPNGPTSEQMSSLIDLVAHICKKYDLEPSRSTVRGHREFCDTACPGASLYPLLEKVATGAKAKLS